MANSGLKERQKKQSDSGTARTRKVNTSVKVKFQAKAPGGSNVFLAGSFNNWNPKEIALKQNGDSLFSTIVNLHPGRHEYKFLINGDWKIDEQCPQQVPNSCGSFNSVIDVK